MHSMTLCDISHMEKSLLPALVF